MWPNPQETVDFVTFTEEIFNGKLHFLRSARIYNLHEKKKPSSQKFYQYLFKSLYQKQFSKMFLYLY